MTKFNEYADFDGCELADLIRKGDVSREDVLDSAIDAARELNPDLNAIVNELFDLAREEAQRVSVDAPFSGVPFLLKDMGPSYKGVPTRMGSRLFADDSTPAHDSFLMQRFRACGLITIGKSSTPEMALSVATESVLQGATRNPWDLARSVGGSSGGSAAAVAAGIVPIAHANDGAGSIRMPASACGIVGYKPSRAMVSWAPEFGECWEGLAINHVVTRSVRDAALMLDHVAGAAPGDPYSYTKPAVSFAQVIESAPATLKIGFTLQAPSGAGPVDKDCEEAVLKAVGHLESLGHSVEEASPKLTSEEMIDPIMTLIVANCSAVIDARLEYLGRALRDDDVEKAIRIFWERGREYTARDYAEAVTRMHLVGRKVGEYFHDYDMWVSPVLSKPPVPIGEFSLNTMDYDGYLHMLRSYMPCTMMFNLSGGPAVSLPLHWTESGLPVGVQFGAAIGNDATLFKLAAQIEATFPRERRRPPVHVSSC
jgi:amidase